MNKKILSTISAGVAMALPVAVFAQVYGGNNLVTAAVNIQTIIVYATRIAYMLAFLAFFWGIAMFLFNAGDDEKRKKGMSIMIWSIVAIFVMTAIWGIVAVLSNTLGANDAAPQDINIPTINFR